MASSPASKYDATHGLHATYPVNIKFVPCDSFVAVPGSLAEDQKKSLFTDSKKRRFSGPIPGISPGTLFANRHDLIKSGTHGSYFSGVYCAKGIVYSLLRGPFDFSGDEREDGIMPFEFSGGRLSESGKDDKNYFANVALCNALETKTPLRLSVAVDQQNSAKYQYKGLYIAHRIRKRKTEKGRRVLLLKPLSKSSPSTTNEVWNFKHPSYLWYGRICQTCSSWISSSINEPHMCNVRSLPQNITASSTITRLSAGSYLFYEPNFVLFTNANALFKDLLNKFKYDYHVIQGKFSENKLTSHAGEKGVHYKYGSLTRHAEGWGALEKYLPELVSHVHRHFVWTVHQSLRTIAEHFGELSSAMQTEAHMRKFAPNFALLNLYADGNNHMNYHQDNETELDQHCVVSLSFGQIRTFSIRQKDHSKLKKPKGYEKTEGSPGLISIKEKKCKKNCVLNIPLGHGSLLVMFGKNFQTDYEHCLKKEEGVTGPRVNVTFRMIDNSKK